MNASAEQNYNQALNTIMNFVDTYVIGTLCAIALAVCIVFGIINGIRYAQAVTDEDKTKAKRAILNVVIGACVVLISLWAVPVIFDLLLEVFNTGNINWNVRG